MYSDTNKSKLRITSWIVNLFLTALLAVVAYGVQSHWISTKRSDRAQLASEIADIKKQLKRTEQITTEHKSFLDLKTSLEKRAEVIKDRIPESPNEGEFLRQTTRAAEKSGVTVKEYRPKGIKTSGDHSSLNIALGVEGNFASICSFVSEIETLPRISKVNRMQISKDASNDTYPLELELTLYFRAGPSKNRIARATE